MSRRLYSDVYWFPRVICRTVRDSLSRSKIDLTKAKMRTIFSFVTICYFRVLLARAICLPLGGWVGPAPAKHTQTLLLRRLRHEGRSLLLCRCTSTEWGELDFSHNTIFINMNLFNQFLNFWFVSFELTIWEFLFKSVFVISAISFTLSIVMVSFLNAL